MAEHTPATCDAQRLRIDLWFLLTAVTLAAIWLSLFWLTTIASKVLLGIYALTYLFGCWKTRRACLLVLPAMYVPYGWLLADWPWGDYRRQWIAMLWQLPGLLAEAAIHPTEATVFAVVTSVTTLIVFFAAIFAARPNLRWASITSFVVCLASIANSTVCYALYRA